MENRIAKEFKDQLKEFDIETLETSSDVIYAIDRDLNFAYFNPKWIEFSETNNGPKNILEQHPIGSSLLAGIGSNMTAIYKKHYSSAFDAPHPVFHEYECSSPELFRMYAQFCFPVADRKAMMIVNRLICEEPFNSKGKKMTIVANAKRFTDRYGYLTQCNNCKCFKPVGEESKWEWVPQWTQEIPEKTSHSICPTCYDFHWKNIK